MAKARKEQLQKLKNDLDGLNQYIEMCGYGVKDLINRDVLERQILELEMMDSEEESEEDTDEKITGEEHEISSKKYT